jgi:hypothetical protein
MLAAALLASCSMASNWHLMDEGYAIDLRNSQEFAVEVHVNQVKQLGEVNSIAFHRFVDERLKWHGLCPSGWALLQCAEDGSCIERTSRSVTILGRCTP